MNRVQPLSQGLPAVRGLAGRRSALVFDLDVALAPIVLNRGDARVPASTAMRLRSLSARWPIAVLTGRSVQDAKKRLGFEPHALFGNHGAERHGSVARHCGRTLDPVRAALANRAAEIQQIGIELEDKGLSLALHYRRSLDPEAACVALDELLHSHRPGLRIEQGHCVVNLMPANAPDKGDALRSLLDEWSLECALVVGDDSNDEPAFVVAPAGSVSVRIGPATRPTTAQFGLELQTEVDALLDLLLRCRPATRVST